MIPQGKKAALMGLNPVDRLSDLPDFVIHHVISFLGTKEAARTTILSKRWTSVWATSPVLDFQPKYFIKEEDGAEHKLGPIEIQLKCLEQETKEKYVSFIETTMQRYSRLSMSIRKLTLEFPKVDHDLAPKLDKWLAIAVENQVEELSLSIVLEDSPKYRLPAIVFSAKSLKCLSCSRVVIPNYEPKKLISLQSLRLEDATIEEDVLQHMISSCPLNKLLLRKCFGLKSILIPHFSKLKTIEYWKTGKTGGTITVESSSLVHLSYYRSDGNGMDFFPWKIHAALSNLKSLEVYDAAITDEMLAKLLSGLALEILTFCGCDLPENICIYGSRLKELSLNHCYGLKYATIDTPNLDMLCYIGDPDISLVATNIPLKCEVYFNMEPEACDTDWFIKLKEFLVESNVFQFLNVWMPEDESTVEFNEDKARKTPNVPPYKLREMRISLPSSVSRLSSLSAFIDGLLWSCLPDQLCIPVTFSGGYMIFQSFMELMKKKVECWRHPLKRIEFASTDCANLLGCSEVEFRFRLYW